MTFFFDFFELFFRWFYGGLILELKLFQIDLRVLKILVELNLTGDLLLQVVDIISLKLTLFLKIFLGPFYVVNLMEMLLVLLYLLGPPLLYLV